MCATGMGGTAELITLKPVENERRKKKDMRKKRRKKAGQIRMQTEITAHRDSGFTTSYHCDAFCHNYKSKKELWVFVC